MNSRPMTVQSRAEASLTCRHWLLDPVGCPNHQCRYSHKITGALSPPSIFACYAFNTGGCPLSQDQCLFAHLVIRPGNRYIQIRRMSRSLSHYSTPSTHPAIDPELTPSDAPIAEAAARADFDCSDWYDFRITQGRRDMFWKQRAFHPPSSCLVAPIGRLGPSLRNES